MDFKTVLFLKGKVVFVVLIFCFLAFCGIVFTFIRSRQLDKEYISLVEFSKKIGIEVYQSRISINEYILKNDSLSLLAINKNLKNAHELVVSIKSMNDKNTVLKNKRITRDLKANLVTINNHILQLQDQISSESLSDPTSIESLTIHEYKAFQESFSKFEINLDRYLTQRNSNFKGEIFTLSISLFIVLVVCLIIIIRLINTIVIVNKQYVEKTMEIEQKERRRIAIDLHDGLGTLLSSISLYVKLLKKESIANPSVKNNLEHISQLSEMTLESLEDVINNLNPAILNKLGLIQALENICINMNNLGNIYFNLETQNFTLKLSKNTELVVFRICNELMNNALKHSGATESKIELSSTKNKVMLFYSDNGVGFNPQSDIENEADKTGLKNMAKRVETLGGTFSIKSERGEGVQIKIRFKTM